jgi:hypothetical protein
MWRERFSSHDRKIYVILCVSKDHYHSLLIQKMMLFWVTVENYGNFSLALSSTSFPFSASFFWKIYILPLPDIL